MEGLLIISDTGVLSPDPRLVQPDVVSAHGSFSELDDAGMDLQSIEPVGVIWKKDVSEKLT
jgi:hypothetical protein